MKNNCLENIEKKRKEGAIIGFTASSFDLLHPGHISMLAEAKANCDYLVVGLLTDPTISRPDTKNKPVQTTFERFVQIQAVHYVDELIPFDSEDDLVQLIKLIKPNIRFCGKEYEGTQHTGYDIEFVNHYYNRRDHDYSTTELRTRIVDTSNNIQPEPSIHNDDLSNLANDASMYEIHNYITKELIKQPVIFDKNLKKATYIGVPSISNKFMIISKYNIITKVYNVIGTIELQYISKVYGYKISTIYNDLIENESLDFSYIIPEEIANNAIK